MGSGDKQITWGPTLLLTVRGLANYLTGKTNELDLLDFINPEFGGSEGRFP